MTLNRKLALVMRKFTAEDAVKSIQNSRLRSGVSVRTGPSMASFRLSLNLVFAPWLILCQSNSYGLHITGGFHGILLP
jgi:hypothetical protein